MNRIHLSFKERLQRSIALLLLLSSLPLFAQQRGKVLSSVPLQQVLVGEEALLNIQISEEQPSGSLVPTEASAFSFRSLPADRFGDGTQAINVVGSTPRTGITKIPSFKIPFRSGTQTTQAFEVEVFPTKTIEWTTLQVGSDNHQIGTVFLHPSGPIYAGQSIPLTAKILFPAELPVGSTGYAEIEKENIGAWRMEAPFPPNYNQRVSPRLPNAIRPREVSIDGKRYQVINYTTFAAPLKEGLVTVGPGKVQGLQIQVTTQTNRGRGFLGTFSRSYNLEWDLPEVTFTAKALPKGAPEGFRGAVGDFSLEASVDLSNELKPGDPVMVNLRVEGKGNLDTLAAPQLDAPDSNWKTYPPSRTEKEGSRRINQGAIEFTQILRPLVAIKEVPPFTFAFFNPTTASYEVLTSEAIPLNLAPLTTASTEVPEAGLIPVAEMKDILGLIEPQSFTPASSFRIGLWWQILPALIVAFLGFILLKRQLPRLQKKNENRGDDLEAKLAELTRNKDASSFLRAASNLADQSELESDDFIRALHDERDRNCFQPEAEAPELSSSRRKEILTGLRERLTQLALLLATLFILHPTPAEAFHNEAQTAWEQGNYQQALDAYQLSLKEEATPDLLYNIGNCYFRLNQPGKAAVYYRRAIQLDPSHPESGQNLAFVERKMGAISNPFSNIPSWLTQLGVNPNSLHPAWAKKLTEPLLLNLLLASLWLFAISLLLRFVSYAPKLKRWTLIGVVAFPILALIFGVTYLYHPGPPLAEFEEADAVVITSGSTPVRSEPNSGDNQILPAEPSTPCLIHTERGDWSYIELFNFERTRGWIQTSSLEKI